MIIHAVRADSVTEVQGAVLHQELFNGLPEPFIVSDGFAVAACGDQPLMIMHLAELVHQGQGAASELQERGGLFSQAFHHFVLRIGE